MIILLSCSCLITLCFRSVKVYIEDMNAVTTMSVPGRVDWKFDDNFFKTSRLLRVKAYQYQHICIWALIFEPLTGIRFNRHYILFSSATLLFYKSVFSDLKSVFNSISTNRSISISFSLIFFMPEGDDRSFHEDLISECVCSSWFTW